MTQSEWFFIACAIIGGVVFLIRMVLLLFGADDPGDLDTPDVADMGHAGNESFNLLSIQGMSSFFLMFGLVGLAILRNNGAVWLAYLGAIGSGVLTVWLISLIFKGMKKMQSDGTLKIQNAIGKEGVVYLTIPAEGSGQVQLAVQGALRIFEARSTQKTRIPTGERIRVIEIIGGNILLVEQITS